MTNLLIDIIAEDAAYVCKRVDLKSLNGKTVLLTGASGLLGQTFLACLLQVSRESNSPIFVHAITQSPFPAYLQMMLKGSAFQVHHGDLTDATFSGSLPKADYIIHAAGYGQPGKFMENKVKTLQLNTSVTFSLFQKLKTNGRFLFVSTSEVYSGLPNPPYREMDIGRTNTTHPRSCYIEGKRCGEAICNAYRTGGIQAMSARLALAYGPGTKHGDTRVLNNFIYKALQEQLTLLDRGEAKRTYCYVSDAVEILWHILLKGTEPLYNVGGKSKTTIAELARSIGAQLNIPVVFPEATGQVMTGAPEDVWLDMTKVEQAFQKHDYLPLEEGLRRTIAWQKALYAQA